MAEAPDDLAQAPDYITPVEGWRLWLVVAEADALQLTSVVHQVAWAPGRPLVAECLRERRPLLRPWRRERPDHAAPAPPCQCGIYAARDPRQLAFFLHGYYAGRGALHRVVGRVALWGTVVECEGGWRAAQAYPVHLYVPPALARWPSPGAEAVAAGLAHYGVPVDILPAAARAPLVALAEAA